jgi:iron complex outermembrane receptor protein
MNLRVLSAALTGVSFFALQSAALAGQAPAANPSSFPEQVVITASPLTNDPNAIASTVGSVDRAKILELGGANIADVLKDLPGVSATSFASGASRPVIRGFDASRVRILEDGIGTFDVSDIGPDHAVPTGPLGTERVEVVRGAATVRYGSQAIGGVVNAINNRVPFGLPDAPISGEAAGGYSTGNKAGDGSVLLDGRADQFAFHADGYIRSTSDYDIPGGTQANSYFKGDGASVGGSYFFGDSRVGAAVIHYDAIYGIPSDITHIKMRQTKELVGSSFDIGLGPLKTITVDGGYGDYKHDEIDPDGVVLDTFIDKEWDTRAESLFGQMGPFSSSAFGIQLQRRDFSALGDARAFLEPTLTRSEAGFAFTELPVTDIFKLQFGARVEQDDIKGTPAGADSQVKRSFTPASGSASLVYNPAEMVTLGLTVSTAGRAPNVVELFAHGPHDGPGTFETGNPDLTIERANSVEGNVRVNMADVQLDASLWGVSFDNYIHGQLTGATCDDTGVCSIPGPGDFKQLNYTQGGARFWGIEGKAAKSLLTTDAGVLVGDIHADYVRATLKEGGDVPLIPPYRVGAGVGWQGGMVDADIHLTYTGPQHRTGEALSPTSGFVDLHIGATWRPMGYLPGLTLSAFADNLTDAKQRNAVALNRDVVMLPGRTFRFVTRYTF